MDRRQGRLLARIKKQLGDGGSGYRTKKADAAKMKGRPGILKGFGGGGQLSEATRES